MRRRPRHNNSIRPIPAIPADAAPAPAAKPAWDDLSEEERIALKRLNRGPYPGLAGTLGRRLVGLGLAVSRPDGIGISRLGRELVIDTLLEARHKDVD